jgi:hypothetical protein
MKVFWDTSHRADWQIVPDVTQDFISSIFRKVKSCCTTPTMGATNSTTTSLTHDEFPRGFRKRKACDALAAITEPAATQ